MKAFKKIRDAIILEKIKRGDNEAFSEIYDEYSQKIYRYIYFKVPDSQTAEDLTGQTFLNFWEYISQTDKTVNNLQAFLYNVAHNLLIDFYRRRKEDMPLTAVDNLAAETDEKVRSKVHLDKDMAKLIATIAKLNDDYNDLVTLHYIEEYSVREIAGILGKTENNVRVTLHRALKALKKLLSDE